MHTDVRQGIRKLKTFRQKEKKEKKKLSGKTSPKVISSETQIRPADLILIGALALLSLLLLTLPVLSRTKLRSPALLIRVDGKEYGTYPLSLDRTIEINDTNVCEIKDGKAKMTSANCPDKICMQENAIGESGGTIVCLPNRIVLSVVNSEEPEGGELDGVAR